MQDLHSGPVRPMGRASWPMGAAALAICLMGLVQLAPSVPTAAAEAVARVEIQNHEFLPAVLTVPAGTTVTWTSHDDDPHTVTSTENAFASPGLEMDDAFSYTFATPGTYPYTCKLHPEMSGTIVVK